MLVIDCHAQPTITTEAPTQTSFCAGGNIIVQYTTTGTFNWGCVFTAQTIPSNTPFGFNYRVRVVSSDPEVIGSTSPDPPIVIMSTAISATISISPSDQVCDGDSVTFWVVPNESYIWSTGETTQSISVTETGTYNVTVTNYFTGCEVTSSPVDILVHPLPQVNLGNDTSFCAGQSHTLDAGTGFTDYDWNNGYASTQQITVDSTGSWFVEVTDTNECKSGDTINITVHPNPEVNLGPDTSVCGTELLLYTDTGMVSYNSNNGAWFNPTFLVTETGMYHVVVTNEYYCKTRDTVFVTINHLPVVDLGNDTAFCSGQSHILDAGAGFTNYNWNNGYASTQQIVVDSTSDWYVEVTDTNSCSSGDMISIIVIPNPVISLGSDTSVCGDEFLLSAGTGFTFYNWNDGESLNPWFQATQTGTYYVLVTDEHGCTAGDTVFVTINPVPEINLGNDMTICGNSIFLGAGQGYTLYEWNSGTGNNYYYMATESGVYSVTVTDANDCTGSDSVTVTLFPLPDIDLGPNIVVDSGSTVTLAADTGFASYIWNNGAETPTILISFIDSMPGTYEFSVYMTDTNGCFNSDNIIITVISNSGIDEIICTSVKIYPNPAADRFVITGLGNQANSKLFITDISGGQINCNITEVADKIFVETGKIFHNQIYQNYTFIC
ncbi:MAG: hypothetical protein HY738_19500 [Bacteroidia bacterium]|nr:hypothetical protein [Bacteroidia bacterium]